MKLVDKLKGTLLFTGISFILIGAAAYLTDFIIFRNTDIGFLFIILSAAIGALLLAPLFFLFRSMTRQGGIEATQLSDLELNERDVREAVSNWVFIHYKKKMEGDMEFSRDENGALNCKITVRSES